MVSEYPILVGGLGVAVVQNLWAHLGAGIPLHHALVKAGDDPYALANERNIYFFLNVFFTKYCPPPSCALSWAPAQLLTCWFFFPAWLVYFSLLKDAFPEVSPAPTSPHRGAKQVSLHGNSAGSSNLWTLLLLLLKRVFFPITCRVVQVCASFHKGGLNLGFCPMLPMGHQWNICDVC